MNTAASSRYTGTSQRGLSQDFTFSVPWGEIAGKTWGDATKPPILCLHGWLDNCNTFDRLIPLLPKDYYYIAMDFPGHGLSSAISNGMFYATITYCGAILRLLKRFEIKNVTVLGHSLGGNIGLVFSSLYPDISNRIVVLDSIGLYFRRKEEVADRLRECLDSYLQLEFAAPRPPKTYTYEQARERLASANKDLTPEAVDILLERGLEEQENGSFVFRRDIRHLYKDAIERTFDGAIAIIEKLRANVLLLWAKEGVPYKFMSGREEIFEAGLRAMKKNSSLKRVDVEGKHHVHLCSPEETASEITVFLKETEKNCTKEDSAANL